MVLGSRIGEKARRLAAMVALVALLAGMMGGGVAAQVPDWNCPADAPTAPDDDFVSGGIGLTCDEWVTLYGPPADIGQDSLIFEISGITVHWRRSNDIRLLFDDDAWKQDGSYPNEVQAALSFLPEDAEHLGVADLATGLRSHQAALVYYSPSLTERNSAIGRPGLGYILVVSAFTEGGLERGPIEQIQVIEVVPRG